VNPEDKLDFKKIMPIFVIVLIDLLGLTIIIPLMPLYATTFGASPLVIGLLGAIYPIMQFIGAPILGRLSDRYGRKPVLLISQIGTFIGFILLGLAQSLPMLFLARAGWLVGRKYLDGAGGDHRQQRAQSRRD
jgi:MFS family permease